MMSDMLNHFLTPNTRYYKKTGRVEKKTTTIALAMIVIMFR